MQQRLATSLTSEPPEDEQRLRAAGVAIDERRVERLRGEGAELDAVVFAGGEERPCGGLLVPAPLRQRGDLAERLGASAAEPNPLMIDALEVDQMARTTAPGVLAAGDVTGRMPSVANSVASGSVAAAMIVHDLALAPDLATAR